MAERRMFACLLLVVAVRQICAGSCIGRCDDVMDRSRQCQCNVHCTGYADCCGDYVDVCRQGSLSRLADTLWRLDINRLNPDSDYVVNYQRQVTSRNNHDNAPLPFFTYLNETKVDSIASFMQFKSLLNNYEPEVGTAEVMTAHEWTEIDVFLDTILSSAVLKEAFMYLHTNGYVANDVAQFRDLIQELWFNTYPRVNGGAVDSSGFEHVMVGEVRTAVTGFHNWFQFFLQENTGSLDYQGFVKVAVPNLVGSQYDWLGHRKRLGSFFLGTSPEFDIALYSVCAITRPNAVCSFNMNGSDVTIQTWDVRHKRGRQIASAYPIL